MFRATHLITWSQTGQEGVNVTTPVELFSDEPGCPRKAPSREEYATGAPATWTLELDGRWTSESGAVPLKVEEACSWVDTRLEGVCVEWVAGVPVEVDLTEAARDGVVTGLLDVELLAALAELGAQLDDSGWVQRGLFNYRHALVPLTPEVEELVTCVLRARQLAVKAGVCW